MSQLLEVCFYSWNLFQW